MPTETITRSSAILPVEIRTARKRHLCNDCEKPIEPGVKYEHSSSPPGRIDFYDVDHWVTWRTHYPRHSEDGGFLPGCKAAAIRAVLTAAIRWLYETVQPDGAILQHHGLGFGTDERGFGFCPSGAANLPVISVDVAHPHYDGYHNITNPLVAGEMAAIGAVIENLGVKVRETWNGDGCCTGSFGLAEPAHPSLLAAVARYRASCPEHKSPFCDCGWYQRGFSLIVHPERQDA